MLRTYDRFASPPECAATSNAGCGGGGGVIGAKDRPGNLTGASDPEVVAWAQPGRGAAFRAVGRRDGRPPLPPVVRTRWGRTHGEGGAERRASPARESATRALRGTAR